MDAFSQTLNSLITRAFRSVLKIEEQMLRRMENLKLSISEVHLIEAVGSEPERGRTISEIAKELSLALPSVTVAVNKLEKKGFIQKTKGFEDGRSVFITLTAQGAKIHRVHLRFHENMVRHIAADMSEAEREALLRGMGKLNAYFDDKLHQEKPGDLQDASQEKTQSISKGSKA